MAAVVKNKDYIVDITDINHEGQGVGRIDGFTVFVDGALVGENVKVKIIKVLKSHAVGKLLEIKIPSTARIEPFCPAYKRCGGCSLQHMSYGAQLEYKTRMVKEVLKRIGKIGNAESLVRDTMGMEHPFEYRNKAQYPVGTAEEKPVIGFYARRSHDIVNVEHCGIHETLGNKIREIFRKFIEENNISVYDETSHKGLVRHLMIRSGFRTGEIMVVVVINGQDLPRKKALVDSLLGQVPGIKSIVLNINTEKTNVILGEKNLVIYGNDAITDYIGDLKFYISPLSFFQVNPVQAEVLYNKAVEFAALSGNETVFDLYCGTGTIALFMARKAKQVYGVETVGEAIADAKRNAKVNGIGNVEFLEGEVEEIVPKLYDAGIKADVVVVDPPRKGCEVSVLDTVANMAPARIVYVSCNPATLARDLFYLGERGYGTVEVQPVDMFPWTAHVECVVLITKL
ncbi:MAG: 23S rRNA (uracil(1939)-C(5))-methyltransferase RlmD [Clostridiaceae bacterium]|nr:23S rRNA (uracil(1939)-C(5))-methyltransferase RlmD [Clostridiaceae bacterium]